MCSKIIISPFLNNSINRRLTARTFLAVSFLMTIYLLMPDFYLNIAE